MNKLPIGLASAMLVLAACQTTPPTSPALEEARMAFNAASADPAVNAAAPQDLQRARDALAVAERAWSQGDETEARSRAYIAKQRANIASEVGARYTAEQQLQQVSVERERIRTEARTRDAQQAEQRAAAARQEATAATEQAAAARQEAATATQQAAAATQQAATVQAQADADRQRAEEQARQLQAERERAAKMEQDLQSLAAKSTARGVVVTLQDVLFDSGKAQLRSGGVRSLERVASVMKSYPERRVMIEGFTDSQGSDSYNLELSQRRADAVKHQLEMLGVPAPNVETHGYGESFPVANNETPSGRQQNRRVEILFSDGTGKFLPR